MYPCMGCMFTVINVSYVCIPTIYVIITMYAKNARLNILFFVNNFGFGYSLLTFLFLSNYLLKHPSHKLLMFEWFIVDVFHVCKGYACRLKVANFVDIQKVGNLISMLFMFF